MQDLDRRSFIGPPRPAPEVSVLVNPEPKKRRIAHVPRNTSDDKVGFWLIIGSVAVIGGIGFWFS